MMIEGQSRFQPFGLSYWGFRDLNKGVGSMTASYDYHIGVDYHKSYSHLVVQDSAGKTLRSGRVPGAKRHSVTEATGIRSRTGNWFDNRGITHPAEGRDLADRRKCRSKHNRTQGKPPNGGVLPLEFFHWRP
ncbi:hypothetical protein E5S70_39075 [Ensifer adhaerens]|nr:hypothetical protein [Ensifer canadensis]